MTTKWMLYIGASAATAATLTYTVKKVKSYLNCWRQLKTDMEAIYFMKKKLHEDTRILGQWTVLMMDRIGVMKAAYTSGNWPVGRFYSALLLMQHQCELMKEEYDRNFLHADILTDNLNHIVEAAGPFWVLYDIEAIEEEIEERQQYTDLSVMAFYTCLPWVDEAVCDAANHLGDCVPID